MATVDDKVMSAVEAALKKDPDVSVDELFAMAKGISPSVGKLSKRQFHAQYPLQVKRRMKPGTKRKSTAGRREPARREESGQEGSTESGEEGGNRASKRGASGRRNPRSPSPHGSPCGTCCSGSRPTSLPPKPARTWSVSSAASISTWTTSWSHGRVPRRASDSTAAAARSDARRGRLPVTSRKARRSANAASSRTATAAPAKPAPSSVFSSVTIAAVAVDLPGSGRHNSWAAFRRPRRRRHPRARARRASGVPATDPRRAPGLPAGPTAPHRPTRTPCAAAKVSRTRAETV